MERRAWSKKMLRMFGIVDLKVMLRIVEREREGANNYYIYIYAAALNKIICFE